MRFRHKLSIVLVGLAIIPLAATGVLIAALLEHDQVTRVDNRVAVSAQAAAESYQLQASKASALARQLAQDPRVSALFAGNQPTVKLPRRLDIPRGMTVVLVGKHGKPIAGNPPSATAWRSRAVYHDAHGRRVGEVDVYIRFGPDLLR